MLTQKRLKELLKYDPLSGVFRWVSIASPKARSIRVGDVAGGKNGNGYVHIRIDGQKLKAHRLAFLFMTGSFPKNDVDHVNGIREDNRWNNLRDVTRAVNKQNTKLHYSTSVLGVLGVGLYRGRFRAQICVNGKRKFIGIYDTVKEAKEAYLRAKRAQHPGNTL